MKIDPNMESLLNAKKTTFLLIQFYPSQGFDGYRAVPLHQMSVPGRKLLAALRKRDEAIEQRAARAQKQAMRLLKKLPKRANLNATVNQE